MFKAVQLAMTVAAFASAPAFAATFNAFPSFNGVNGNGNFSYGYTDGTTLTPFDTSATNGNCALLGNTTCLRPSFASLPQASVGGNFPTVTVPADAVLVHPGDSDSLSVYGGFIAPVASTYTYDIDLQSVGIDTTSTGIRTFTSVGGTITLGTRSLLATYLAASSFTGSVQLAAGDQFGFIVDRNGSYGGDSTSVNFAISNVPEPATWGLMLVGFGMVGFAARRRSTTIAA